MNEMEISEGQLLVQGFGVCDPSQAAQPSQPRDIEVITAEILDAKRAGGEAILTIGKGLMEAKALLSHGEWLPWLTEKVEFSESSAQRFMRLAREWSNPSTLTDLGASKALQLLALPESERDAFLSEVHEVNGEEKSVIDMSARELAQAIKERDEALKAAEQAKADQKAADDAQKKMAQDIALANERIAGLNAEVEAKSAKVRESEDARNEALKKFEQARAELEALRSRPVEVAVEADPAAVKAARKKAEEAMRAKVDEANQARIAAENLRAEDKLNLANAREELKKAAADLEALRTRAEQAEKRAALASNEDLVLFRTLFDQVQETVNKMSGVLMKCRAKDPEKAQGLAKALAALAQKIQGVAAQ